MVVHCRVKWIHALITQGDLISGQLLEFAGWQHAVVQIPAFADGQLHKVILGRAARCEWCINRRMERQQARHQFFPVIMHQQLLGQAAFTKCVAQLDRVFKRQVLIGWMMLIHFDSYSDEAFTFTAAEFLNFPSSRM
ncbi:hypothetical protein D3C80_1543740 [compost metagenome]